MARRPRGRRAGVAVALVLLVAALLGVRTWAPHRSGCSLSRELVPSCGVLLGVAPPTPTLASLRRTEAWLGRRVDLVYTFHDLDDRVPSAYERALVASGSLLHVSIDARIFGAHGSGPVRWSDVAAGAYDDRLRRQARGIAALRRPVFVTFDHEADQPSNDVRGTPADFVRAWRHVHDLFERVHARNVVWVWVVLGWPSSFPTAGRMWPGDSYVDWISWDAYNDASCRTGQPAAGGQRTFAEVALPFLRWLHHEGADAGIDVHKPLMISETGTMAYRAGSSAEAAWFRGMVRVVRHHPAIRAVTLWDHRGSVPACDYRFSVPGRMASAGRGLAAFPRFTGSATATR